MKRRDLNPLFVLGCLSLAPAILAQGTSAGEIPPAAAASSEASGASTPVVMHAMPADARLSVGGKPAPQPAVQAAAPASTASPSTLSEDTATPPAKSDPAPAAAIASDSDETKDTEKAETSAGAKDGAKPAAVAAAPAPPPQPTISIDINLTTQRMTVSENGQEKHTWSISSARAGYRTPTGTFKPTWMSRMWYSRQYDYSPMPHSIFFSGGVAIHATYATGMLGRPASHGCVRLAPANAKTLYGLVSKHGKERTRIVVHGVPNTRAPAVAKKKGTTQRYAVRPGYRAGSYGGYSYNPGYGAPRTSYVKPRRTARQGNYAGNTLFGF